MSGLALASSLTGEDTTLSLEMTVCGALNLAGTDGGLIRIDLPDGFQVALFSLPLTFVLGRERPSR